MTTIEADNRSPERKKLDEEIALKPEMPIPELPPNTQFLPLESQLRRSRRHPEALTGIVENGVVRFLDANVKLPEHSRVIIVAESA